MPSEARRCLSFRAGSSLVHYDVALLRMSDTLAVAYASADFLRGIHAISSKEVPQFQSWEWFRAL